MVLIFCPAPSLRAVDKQHIVFVSSIGANQMPFHDKAKAYEFYLEAHARMEFFRFFFLNISQFYRLLLIFFVNIILREVNPPNMLETHIKQKS